MYKDGRRESFDARDRESVLLAQNLRQTYDGERYQFLNVDFGLNEGQKVAIVGPNGSGKSTLLQVLGGRRVGLEDGDVWRRKGLRVCFVDQEPVFNPELTVIDAVYATDTPVMRVLRKYDAVMAAASRGELDEMAMSDAMADMDALNAWDLEEKTQVALKKLGCNSFIENKMGELSGGQRKRVALAAALVETPDLLILDEPTNHLSVEGVEWLEEQLQDPTLTVLLVSHDRMFIDNVCPGTFVRMERDDATDDLERRHFRTRRQRRIVPASRRIRDLFRAASRAMVHRGTTVAGGEEHV